MLIRAFPSQHVWKIIFGPTFTSDKGLRAQARVKKQHSYFTSSSDL